MQPIPQAQWHQIVEESKYTIPIAATAMGMDCSQFRRYLAGKVTPRKKNMAAIQEFMMYFQKKENKAIPYHPIRGYATEEQWEKLQKLPLGAERNYLMQQIEKQTAKKGKM